VPSSPIVQTLRAPALAFNPDGPAQLAVTTDVLVEGVHFYRDVAPRRLGHKCAAVNLSDLAAMGAAPQQIIVVVTCPQNNLKWRSDFERGAKDLCAREKANVHVTFNEGAHTRISVVAVGRVDAQVALTRDGGRVGHLIAVTGTLGDAGGALELLGSNGVSRGDADHRALISRLECPTPRVSAGMALSGSASGALDVSDGLSGDLGHLLHEQAPGIRINIESLPLSEALKRVFPIQVAQSLAFSAGDDYELCITIPSARFDAAQRTLASLGVPLTRIGQIVDTAGIIVVDANGTAVDRDAGYQHNFD
jgi:thiamine-monophosphate kinase